YRSAQDLDQRQKRRPEQIVRPFVAPTKTTLLIEPERAREKRSGTQPQTLESVLDGKLFGALQEPASHSLPPHRWGDGHAPQVERLAPGEGRDCPHDDIIFESHPRGPLAQAAANFLRGENRGGKRFRGIGRFVLRE